MPDVLVEQRGGACWITINRPEKRNPLSQSVWTGIREAIQSAATDRGIRCLVLAGAGPVFSAGADLKEFLEAGDAAKLAADGRRISETLDAVAASPKPVIARVQGAAMAGAIGLLAAADIVVAADNAIFALTEVRIGLVPAAIGPIVLKSLGRREALPHMLTGARFDAREAQRIGLVHQVVPADELDAAVESLIADFAACAPGALAVTKWLVDEIADMPPREARELTVKIAGDRRASAEGQEGMSSFLEKRKPHWTEPS